MAQKQSLSNKPQKSPPTLYMALAIIAAAACQSFPDTAPPGTNQDPPPSGGADMGCLSCGSDLRPEDPGQDGGTMEAKVVGQVLVRQTSAYIPQFGQVSTNWDVIADLGAQPKVTGSVMGCTIAEPSAQAATLDAGDLTITGGLSGPLTLTLNPDSGLYELPEPDEDEEDPSAGEGALFSESSQLSFSAAGGTDIKAVSGQGTWRGVKSLEIKAPMSLDKWPTGDMAISWTAQPTSGVTMEVQLYAQNGTQITCPVLEDSGSYTLKKEVLGAVPSGAVYIFLSRVQGTSVKTTPDVGSVVLQSRSQWQYITRKP